MKRKARTKRASKWTHATAWHCMNLLSGARDRNRTCDLRVTSALLYRLSYTGGGLNLALSLWPGNLRHGDFPHTAKRPEPVGAFACSAAKRGGD